MDSTLISNLENTPAVAQYLATVTRYTNKDSNLYKAQVVDDSYASLKERTAMVFEYYKTKDAPRVSIEMYINPNKLSIGTQKVISKNYTRGGIFYHHWGDDHAQMSLSGTVGYSSMRGIEALEEVYYASGTLLRNQNYGINSVNSSAIDTSSDDSDDSDNPLSGLNKALTGYLDKITGTASDFTGKLLSDNKLSEIGKKLESGYENVVDIAKGISKQNGCFGQLTKFMAYSEKTTGKLLGFSDLFQQAKSTVSKQLSTTHQDVQHAIAYDLANALTGKKTKSNLLTTMLKSKISSINNVFTSLDELASGNINGAFETILPSQATSGNYYDMGSMSTTDLQRVISEVQQYNESRKIDTSKAANGWSDIADELTDEWRPRQVIIYFEDRVYIGHFTAFNYNRVAEHPLIHYDMKLNITRQIKMTSNS